MADGGEPGCSDCSGQPGLAATTKPGMFWTLPERTLMQILHPFTGSIQQYVEEISDPGRYRPDHCPQCGSKQPLTGHGFYRRTLVDPVFDGAIRVRRYLCRSCKRTVSLLPEFALQWAAFQHRRDLAVSDRAPAPELHAGGCGRSRGTTNMPYQRGQFWIRRFRKQAPALGVSLGPLAAPAAAADFVARALRMLESASWIAAHRFLLSQLRVHLLGWPRFLSLAGRRIGLAAAESGG